MSKDDILLLLEGIFKDELDNDNIRLRYETVADDIDEWDSLTHVQLVVAIEKKFKIRFSSSEINSWANVGEICASILGKLTK